MQRQILLSSTKNSMKKLNRFRELLQRRWIHLHKSIHSSLNLLAAVTMVLLPKHLHDSTKTVTNSKQNIQSSWKAFRKSMRVITTHSAISLIQIFRNSRSSIQPLLKMQLPQIIQKSTSSTSFLWRNIRSLQTNIRSS